MTKAGRLAVAVLAATAIAFMGAAPAGAAEIKGGMPVSSGTATLELSPSWLDHIAEAGVTRIVGVSGAQVFQDGTALPNRLQFPIRRGALSVRGKPRGVVHGSGAFEITHRRDGLIKLGKIDYIARGHGVLTVYIGTYQNLGSPKALADIHPTRVVRRSNGQITVANARVTLTLEGAGIINRATQHYSFFAGEEIGTLNLTVRGR